MFYRHISRYLIDQTNLWIIFGYKEPKGRAEICANTHGPIASCSCSNLNYVHTKFCKRAEHVRRCYVTAYTALCCLLCALSLNVVLVIAPRVTRWIIPNCRVYSLWGIALLFRFEYRVMSPVSAHTVQWAFVYTNKVLLKNDNVDGALQRSNSLYCVYAVLYVCMYFRVCNWFA